MTLTLYTTADDPRKVSKNLTVVAASVGVVPTAAVEQLSPVFVIDYNASYMGANYCYCDLFGRYYYIDSINVDIGKKMILTCKIDVLMTYATGIRAAQATVIRSESIGKPTYVPDNQLPVNPVAVDLESQIFTGGDILGQTASFLLQTMGGSGT